MSRPARPLVIAHRGASGYRPENTLPAYRLAVEQRADMIEVDLHQTRDGVIALAHDDDLTRWGGQGVLGGAGFEEIRALDVGGGERVPSLDETLDAFGDAIAFNLEIKCPPAGPYPGLEAATLEVLGRRELLPRTLLSSFSDAVLETLRKLSPEARLATLVPVKNADHAVERARCVGAEAVNPHLVHASEALVREAHAAGLAVYVYTVDDEAWMLRLLARGVDGMFSNYPDRLRRVVDGASSQAAELDTEAVFD